MAETLKTPNIYALECEIESDETTESYSKVRAFIRSVLDKNHGDWYSIAYKLYAILKQDHRIVVGSFGIDRARISSDRTLAITHGFVVLGYPIEILVSMFPGTNEQSILRTCLLVRDLLMLCEPEEAACFGYTIENCSHRALRAFGIEPRTRYQKVYREFLEKSPDVFDKGSDVYERWSLVLREFNEPHANLGQLANITPHQAINLVRLIFLEGYRIDYAARVVGFSASTMFVLTVAFTSLYVLRALAINDEDVFPSEIKAIPVFPRTEKHMKYVKRVLNLADERDQVAEVVAQARRSYETHEEQVFLNPLQLVVLDAFAHYKTNTLIKEFEEFGVSRTRFLNLQVSLRRLSLGKTFNGDVPFRGYLRRLVFTYLGGYSSSLVSRVIALSGQAYVPPIELLSNFIDASGNLCIAGYPIPYEKAQILTNMIINNHSVRSAAREVGIGKNTAFNFCLRLEELFYSYYFPSYFQSMRVLDLSGSKVQGYLRNRALVFQSPALVIFTSDETLAWEIARQRAEGKTVEEIMQLHNLSYGAISSLTYLAIIASVRYPQIDEYRTPSYERRQLAGEQFLAQADLAVRCIFIGDHRIQLSFREYQLINLLFNQFYQGVTLELAYKVLYPEDQTCPTPLNVMYSRVNRIMDTLTCKLGIDIREDPFFIVDNTLNGIFLNQSRWNVSHRGIGLSYQHPPFGTTTRVYVDESRTLHIEYETHDRQVRLTPEEVIVFQCIAEFPTWIHYQDIIEVAQLEYNHSLDIYAIRGAVRSIQLKLSLRNYQPGSIVSDRCGCYRSVTYPLLTLPIQPFYIDSNRYELNTELYIIRDDYGVTYQLSARESDALECILSRVRSLNPVVKHSLLLRLKSYSLLPPTVHGFSWDKNITRINPQNPLHVRSSSIGTVVDIYIPDKDLSLNIVLPQEAAELFTLDPFDTAFSDTKDLQRRANTQSSLDNISFDSTELIPDIVRLEAVEYPLLSPVGEAVLFIRYSAGDQNAFLRLFRSNQRLAVGIVKGIYIRKHLYNTDISILDLIQEAYLGLQKAIEMFDISITGRETPIGRLSTYATRWIRQHVDRYIINTRDPIRTPIHESEFRDTVYRTRSQILHEGLSVSSSEIAQRLCKKFGWKYPYTLKKVNKILQRQKTLSLDHPIRDDGEYDTEFIESIPDQSVPPPIQVDDSLRHDEIMEALSNLNPRLRYIIIRRYGFDGDEPMTLEEIGKILGLTRERIRQLETKALASLRHLKIARKLRPYT